MARECKYQQSKAKVSHQMPHQYSEGIEGELYPFEIPAIKYSTYPTRM